MSKIVVTSMYNLTEIVRHATHDRSDLARMTVLSFVIACVMIWRLH